MLFESDGKYNYYSVSLKDNPEALKLFVFETESQEVTLVSDYGFKDKEITDAVLKNTLGSTFEFASKAFIELYISNNIRNTIQSHLPNIIYWKSSDTRHLINEPINLIDFSNNPSSISQPLYSCFKIAGITNIKDRIELIQEDAEEKPELEQELSDSVTSFINNAWKEHKINIRFRIEGMECYVSVEDKDNTKPKFQMKQRSDGFKQFISILLSISANDLSNNIIILDEPEVHLHPSGVKYLREELLKIAKNNYVIIATHSIYMVDKLNLNRHFQVNKTQSITSLKQINKNDPYQEEVIYEALGTSIFEHIHPNVLLLEGDTDKDIFDAFMQKFKSNKAVNTSITVISLQGVTNLPKYAKFIDGKLIKGFVVVDSDQQGISSKEQLTKDNENYTSNNTFQINDLFELFDGATLEDLLPTKIINDTVKEEYDITISLDEAKPVISQIQQILKDEGKIKSEKDKLTKLKVKISLNMISLLVNKSTTLKKTEEEIFPKYTKFFFNLHKKIK